MANIDHYLEEIEVASRGEEVRDSIIDAFEALNSEGPGTMAWNNITGTPDTLTGYGVSDVPASMVSGVLALNNIPPSALERMVPVANDTARFALTLSDAQNGDTVKVLSTQKLYLVVDDTSLSTEAGYEEYRAGTADSVDWSGVLNTPDTLAGYGIEDAYTKTQTDTALAAKSDKATTYTKDEVDDITTSEEVESEAGNPIVVETDAAQYAKNTHLTLAPVQDLHGYDYPWPAGGGKNLLDDSAKEVGTFSDVTVSQNSKGQFILNGTATANNNVKVGVVTLPAGSYIFSGMKSTGSSSTFFLNLEPQWNGTSNQNLYSGEYSGTSDAERTYTARIYFRSGQSFSNTIFEPMLRKSTDSADFAPYSNICPITGVDEVEVRATGKNLLNWNDFVQGSISSVGIDTVANTRLRSQFVKVEQLTNYTFSTNSNVLVYEIHFYDNNKNFISFRSVNLTSTTVQTVQDAEYVKVLLRKSDNLVITVDEGEGFQMELGSTATDYEPYTSSEVSVDLPEPVYSGTLDLETGEVVVDWKKIKLRDLSIPDRTTTYFYSSTTTDKACGATKVKCSCYKTIDVSAGDMPECSIKGNGGNSYLYITDTRFSTGAELKNALGDQDIAYELATPITYQLTPQQLALFKGTNVISTNAKTVQVTYRNGELATTGNIVDAVEVAKQNAIGESASYTDARLATELAPILGNLATAETSPASASHAVGEYLLYNNRLYKVLAAISAGQQLTIGTNIGQTSVAAELTRLNSLLT